MNDILYGTCGTVHAGGADALPALTEHRIVPLDYSCGKLIALAPTKKRVTGQRLGVNWMT